MLKHILEQKDLVYIKLTADGITSPIAKFLSEDEQKAIIEKRKLKQGCNFYSC